MFTIHVRLFRTPIQNSSNEVFFLAEDTDYTCLYLKEQVVKYCMLFLFLSYTCNLFELQSKYERFCTKGF